MAYKAIANNVVPQQLTDVASTAQLPLGTIVQGVDEVFGIGEFIYLKGVASTVVGSVVVYNADDFSTALAATNSIGPVAVALAATVANTFGWYQISGKALVKSATVVDDANVYLTATAGQVDDTVVAGQRVKLAKFASADAAGVAECEIHRPFVDNGVAA